MPPSITKVVTSSWALWCMEHGSNAWPVMKLPPFLNVHLRKHEWTTAVTFSVRREDTRIYKLRSLNVSCLCNFSTKNWAKRNHVILNLHNPDIEVDFQLRWIGLCCQFTHYWHSTLLPNAVQILGSPVLNALSILFNDSLGSAYQIGHIVQAIIVEKLTFNRLWTNVTSAITYTENILANFTYRTWRHHSSIL